MSEEKKELINEELNDEKKELTQEELEQVNGGTKNPANPYDTQSAKLAGATCQAEINVIVIN